MDAITAPTTAATAPLTPDVADDGTPYDPHFDPLVSSPGCGQRYAPTYWVATAGPPPQDDGPVTADIDADVVREQ